ncbi:MAG TPA: alpha/beta fold hydrolase [Gemmatimonadaceae bacterium]|nr:alpha/beta fold hydrolase [Gemmatimonadaceae bacterium]
MPSPITTTTTRRVTFENGIAGTATDVADAARPPVLYVHGMFGGAWMFDAFQRWMAACGWPGVAIDLRGRDGSRPVDDIGRVSMRDHVDDALGVARAMGRPIVVGHSMGGLIAQKLAEADAVRAAVLLCAAPPRGISVASASLLARQLKHAPALLLSRPLVPTRGDAEALMFNRVPPAEHDALFTRLVPESGRAGLELSLGLIAVDARRVRCPVLSVAASDDRFLAPRIGRALAARYHAELREYAEHGHFIIGEPGWERVAEEVAGWLECALSGAGGQGLEAGGISGTAG